MSRRRSLPPKATGSEKVSWKKKALAWFFIGLLVSTAAISLLYYVFEG